jgi:hypothetical protein
MRRAADVLQHTPYAVLLVCCRVHAAESIDVCTVAQSLWTWCNMMHYWHVFVFFCTCTLEKSIGSYVHTGKVHWVIRAHWKSPLGHTLLKSIGSYVQTGKVHWVIPGHGQSAGHAQAQAAVQLRHTIEFLDSAFLRAHCWSKRYLPSPPWPSC